MTRQPLSPVVRTLVLLGASLLLDASSVASQATLQRQEPTSSAAARRQSLTRFRENATQMDYQGALKESVIILADVSDMEHVECVLAEDGLNTVSLTISGIDMPDVAKGRFQSGSYLVGGLQWRCTDTRGQTVPLIQQIDSIIGLEQRQDSSWQLNLATSSASATDCFEHLEIHFAPGARQTEAEVDFAVDVAELKPIAKHQEESAPPATRQLKQLGDWELLVDNPSASDTLSPGQTVNITWSTTAPREAICRISVESFSPVGEEGTTCFDVVVETPNSGSFSWEVSPTAWCRCGGALPLEHRFGLKVLCTYGTGAAVNVMYGVQFAEPDVTAPAELEGMTAPLGTSHTIAWESSATSQICSDLRKLTAADTVSGSLWVEECSGADCELRMCTAEAVALTPTELGEALLKVPSDVFEPNGCNVDPSTCLRFLLQLERSIGPYVEATHNVTLHIAPQAVLRHLDESGKALPQVVLGAIRVASLPAEGRVIGIRARTAGGAGKTVALRCIATTNMYTPNIPIVTLEPAENLWVETVHIEDGQVVEVLGGQWVTNPADFSMGQSYGLAQPQIGPAAAVLECSECAEASNQTFPWPGESQQGSGPNMATAVMDDSLSVDPPPFSAWLDETQEVAAGSWTVRSTEIKVELSDPEVFWSLAYNDTHGISSLTLYMAGDLRLGFEAHVQGEGLPLGDLKLEYATNGTKGIGSSAVQQEVLVMGVPMSLAIIAGLEMELDVQTFAENTAFNGAMDFTFGLDSMASVGFGFQYTPESGLVPFTRDTYTVANLPRASTATIPSPLLAQVLLSWDIGLAAWDSSAWDFSECLGNTDCKNTQTSLSIAPQLAVIIEHLEVAGSGGCSAEDDVRAVSVASPNIVSELSGSFSGFGSTAPGSPSSLSWGPWRLDIPPPAAQQAAACHNFSLGLFPPAPTAPPPGPGASPPVPLANPPGPPIPQISLPDLGDLDLSFGDDGGEYQIETTLTLIGAFQTEAFVEDPMVSLGILKAVAQVARMPRDSVAVSMSEFGFSGGPGLRRRAVLQDPERSAQATVRVLDLTSYARADIIRQVLEASANNGVLLAALHESPWLLPVSHVDSTGGQVIVVYEPPQEAGPEAVPGPRGVEATAGNTEGFDISSAKSIGLIVGLVLGSVVGIVAVYVYIHIKKKRLKRRSPAMATYIAHDHGSDDGSQPGVSPSDRGVVRVDVQSAAENCAGPMPDATTPNFSNRMRNPMYDVPEDVTERVST